MPQKVKNCIINEIRLQEKVLGMEQKDKEANCMMMIWLGDRI